MENSQQSIECDVLVIGAAAAGLTAAIEATERGASVVVISKDKAGRSGNTVVAEAGMSAVVPHEGCVDSPEQHLQDTVAGGRGINDENLVRLLAERGGQQVMKLEDWGVPILHPEHDPSRRAAPGHRWPRGIHPDCYGYPTGLKGISITRPLSATAERKGVRLLDQCLVIRLALEEGEAAGAVAIDLERGTPVTVRARAVVEAAGGGGQQPAW